LTNNIRPVSVPTTEDLRGSYIVIYTTAPAANMTPEPNVHAEASMVKAVQLADTNVVTVNSQTDSLATAQLTDKDSEDQMLLDLAVSIVSEFMQDEEPSSKPVEQTKGSHEAATPLTSSVIETKPLSESEVKITSSLVNSASIIPKTITVRKLNAKRGGAEVVQPQSIQELLTVGGELLGISAVKVRRMKTEAEIRDVSTIQHEEIVYLTTEEDEKEF
jgi:hypothetical protein